MSILKIAQVGCGGMGRWYRHRYNEVEGARLELVIDTNEEAAKKAAEELNCRWSTKFEDCLADDIDVVDISTPNFLHADQACAAIEAGKHVIIQKPITPSVEEAERIVAAAKKTDKNVGMYMSKFNSPLAYDLKRLIQEGHMGYIEATNCRNAHRGGLTVPAGTWRGDLKKCGGGSFIQLAIHNIDFVQWLLDDKIKTVMAYSQNTQCPNIGGDDATAAAFQYESGRIGTLSSSYCADRNECAVYGTKGHFLLVDDLHLMLCLDGEFDGEVIHYHEPGKIVELPNYERLDLYHQENPYDQSIAFVKAILEGKPAPVSVETGLYDLKVVKAVYESAATKSMVEVK